MPRYVKSGGVLVPRGLAFDYHATADKKRRTAPVTLNKSEDKHLDVTDRRSLIATARDNRRNQAILAWAIRQHLDFVTAFTFEPRTGDEALDADLAALVAWRGRRGNWDVAGRHNRARYVRLLEACRTVDGDVFDLLTGDGRHQAIEGDRVATPTYGGLPERYKAWALTHGVRTDAAGAPEYYCVCKRAADGYPATPGGSQLEFDRMLRADRVKHLGYYDRFDAVRGVSPLASALNAFTDAYETMEYERVKQKMHSMLGVFIKRAAATGSDGFNYVDRDTGDDPTNSTSRYDFEMVPGVKIEGDPGDEAQMLESRTPSEEFQTFLEMNFRCGLLALDIPYTFFNVAGASYAGQRMDLIRYMKSVRAKQEDLREYLIEVTALDLARWIAPEDGSAPLLRVPAKYAPDGLPVFDWIPDGVPWVDPVKEVNAEMMAVSAGFTTRDRVAKSKYGTTFAENVKRLGEEEKMAVAASATLAIGMPGQQTTREEELNNEANATEDDGNE